MKQKKDLYVEVCSDIYKHIQDGKVQVVINEVEIIEGEEFDKIKLYCLDEHGNSGEYMVFCGDSPSSVFAQLVRAVTSREVSQLKLSMIKGKQIYATIVSKGMYSNITGIKKVDREDYFEIEEDELEEELESTSKPKKRSSKKKPSKYKSSKKRSVQEDEETDEDVYYDEGFSPEL